MFTVISKQPKRLLVAALRFANRERGAATVEMAFVAPFVFFLIFASIEFSRMMMMQQALTNAAREGCRKATLVTTSSSTQIEQHVRETLKGTIKNLDDPETVQISISPDFESRPDSGTTITIKISIDCNDVSWFPTSLFNGIRISGQAVMERE